MQIKFINFSQSAYHFKEIKYNSNAKSERKRIIAKSNLTKTKK